MHRKILLMLTFIFCLSWTEVKVEKVLETTSIKEYNQWVKQNKVKCPTLKPELVLVKQTRNSKTAGSYNEVFSIERTFSPPISSPFNSEYKIYYYDSVGNLKNIQVERGYISVWLYDEEGYIRIIRHDHPVYPSRSILEMYNVHGNVVFSPDDSMPYIFPTCAGFFIEYPFSIEGGRGEHPIVRIFSQDGRMLTKLTHVWTVDRVVLSPDTQHIALYALENENSYNRTLILISRNGKELWRKTIVQSFDFVFLDNHRLAIGTKGKVHEYGIDGKRLHIYNAFNDRRNPLTRYIADKDILVTSIGPEIHLYDNELKEKIQEIKIPESSVMRYLFTNIDGSHSIAIYNSHKVYILNNNTGTIVKIFKVLMGEETHYRKELNGSDIVMKKYIEPITNWKCYYSCNYLIFKTQSKDEPGVVHFIVYQINV